MLKYKIYVKILSLILVIIFGGSFLYVYHFSKTYPVPFTYRISLDEKFRFIRDIPDKTQIDTIIVGSSIGLNNIQGIILEESSSKVNHVVNISAYGLKTTEVEKLLNIISIFPNLKRVIYSAHFPDFSEAFTPDDYNLPFVKDYLNLEKETIDLPHAFHAYKNIIQFVKNHWNWEKQYKGDMFNFGLAFDKTGSIPLKLYGDDINRDKFDNPHPLTQDEENFKALERIAKNLQKEHIKFYLIIGPYRQPLLDKHEDVRQTMSTFVKKTDIIMQKYHGLYFNLHPILKLSDDYFVDRFHLNEQGSKLTAKTIGKFIDENE